MRALGISVWIHFIWIFVVGIILFFHLVHTPYEGFSGSGSGSGSGSSRSAQVWVQTYNSGTGVQAAMGSKPPGWYPINKSTDRLLYQEKLPVGGSLYSTNGKYSLSFGNGGVIQINQKTGATGIWLPTLTFQSSLNASYIFHQGDINVINTDGTAGQSPFVLGSTFGWVAVSTGSTGSTSTIDQTTCYLQMQNDGDVVFKTLDGVTLYHTNTGVPPDPCEGINYGNYPSNQVNCFTLQNLITTKQALLSSLETETSQIISTQKMLCMLQNQDQLLQCPLYRATHTDPSIPRVVTPLVKPSIMIGANLNSGENIIRLQAGANNPTATTDLTAQISVGDMVYLGYGPDIQGPFIVYSINSTTITITKKYVGTNITNMPISLIPVASKSGNTICTSGMNGYNGGLVTLSTGSTNIFTGINYAYYANYNRGLGETDYGAFTGFQGSCPPKTPPSSAVLYAYNILATHINSVCLGKSSCTVTINTLNSLIGTLSYVYDNVLALNLFYTNPTATLAPSSNPVKMKVSGEDAIVSFYPGEKSITIDNSDPVSGLSGQSTCSTATDGNTLTLTSSHGPFSSIDFIYYGTTVTGTCATTIRAGYDTTASSNAVMQQALTDYVTAQCIGKTSCSITVSPSSMGVTDPSVGNTKTLAVSLSTAMNTLPDNLALGDIVFIKSSTCQPYDTDNGDGTCTRVLCNVGEKDIGNGICVPYSCNSTIPSTLETAVQDTNNNDGTCTTSSIYSDCQVTETFNSTNNTCNSAATAPIQYSYARSVKQNPYVYDITKRGIPGIAYSKSISLSGSPGVPPYTFNASLETGVILANSTTEKGYNTSIQTAITYSSSSNIFFDAMFLQYNSAGVATITTDIIATIFSVNKPLFSQISTINNRILSSYGEAQNVTAYAVNYLNLANQFLSTSYNYLVNDQVTTIISLTSQWNAYKTNVDTAITAFNTNFTLTNTAQNLSNFKNIVNAVDTLSQCTNARVSAYKILYTRLNTIYAPLQSGSNLNSYKYNKQYGPFVINQSPTPNTLIIKSLLPGTLDSDDNFVYNPRYTFMQLINSKAASNDGTAPTSAATLNAATTLLIPLTVESFVSASPVAPPVTGPTQTGSTTITNAYIIRQTLGGIGELPNAVPEGGIQNAKLYKLDYTDGSFNGSYTSLVAGDSCGTGQLTTQNSITFSLTGSATTPSVSVNSMNLMLGIKYQLVVSVRVSGSTGTSGSTSSYKMKLEYAPSKYYMMSTDTATVAGNTDSANLTSTFTMFVWNFTAVSPTIAFRINKPNSSTNTTIEFNGISIQGGLTGPLLSLACANGTSVNGATTVCNQPGSSSTAD